MPKSALGWIILIIIAYWVITEPAAAGHLVHAVFSSIGTFLRSL